MYFKSALPLSAKTNYIRNEIKRNHKGCSQENEKITYIAHFITPPPQKQDYSTSIKWHLNNKKSLKLHTPSNTCFLKLKHFGEIITEGIRRAIYKEGLVIQLEYSGPSIHQYLTKKNNNTITTCNLANCPIRDTNIYQKHTIYCLTCLKCHNF